MLNEAECLSQSVRFSAQAELCSNQNYREEYLALETGWLQVAVVAAYQDNFVLSGDSLNPS